MAQSFEQSLAAIADRMEHYLSGLLDNGLYQPRLHEAMRYAALGAGKRMRPFLLIECARLLDVKDEISLHAAASLECVHCYSLVHDDLPSMDNDSLRRGRPTLHVAYDEATAILAGDALLTLAFEILANAGNIAPAIRLSLISELSMASGAAGMAGGQMLDLAAEGRFENIRPEFTEAQILDLQAKKTGALIRYAVRAGALLGSASEQQLAQLTRYGENLGLLYQLADDLLDATGSQEKAGKTVAKDAKAGKATLVSLLGVDAARARLKAYAQQAEEALEGFSRADNLRALPAYLAGRVS